MQKLSSLFSFSGMILERKTLYLLRGLPASGKSSWIKKHGAEKFTLEPDAIRLELSPVPVVLPDGTRGIDQSRNKEVFEILFRRLSKRLKTGEPVVIDATNLRRIDILSYEEKAIIAGYELCVVDFTSVPFSVCFERNAKRLPDWKRVPAAVMEKMRETLARESVPDRVRVISFRE